MTSPTSRVLLVGPLAQFAEQFRERRKLTGLNAAVAVGLER